MQSASTEKARRDFYGTGRKNFDRNQSGGQNGRKSIQGTNLEQKEHEVGGQERAVSDEYYWKGKLFIQ